MRPPRSRLRSLMILVLISALAFAAIGGLLARDGRDAASLARLTERASPYLFFLGVMLAANRVFRRRRPVGSPTGGGEVGPRP